MIDFFKNIYLCNRLFFALGGIIILAAFGFALPLLFAIAQAFLVLLCVLVLVDAFLLFGKNTQLKCERKTPNLLSLGSENPIDLILDSQSKLALKCTVLDELPMQFQERNFQINLELKANELKKTSYTLRPLSRGTYEFGRVNVFAQSFLGLIERRFPFALENSVPVYPSIMEMKKYELYGSKQTSVYYGIKKMRRIGHSYEFEQIKNYVQGDDIRSINWKATGRNKKVMVNQYEDEKSQQVYAIIDKSRAMYMPFEGLSLLDYAINSSLVISNVALQKKDKAGLITFSDKIGSTIKAENQRTQLRKILHSLYKEQERSVESNYELLFIAARNIIKRRSLVFLFTNFESLYALERVLPVLRKLNQQHLLVVLFFENTEITNYTQEKVANLEDIYQNTIARKMAAEKQQIYQELRKYGIQCIVTQPEKLTINTINKYLELKARGMI